jgi:hypothetical protein
VTQRAHALAAPTDCAASTGAQPVRPAVQDSSQGSAPTNDGGWVASSSKLASGLAWIKAIDVHRRDRSDTHGRRKRSMAKKRITSIGLGTPLVAGSISWEYIASNRDLARRVLVFLEPRRVLYESPAREDYEQCRLSAQDIKNFLTLEIMNVKSGGELESSFKAMRSACLAFGNAAGINSANFQRNPDLFQACLQAFKDAMGTQIGWLAETFEIPIDPALEAIVPFRDISEDPDQSEASQDPL